MTAPAFTAWPPLETGQTLAEWQGGRCAFCGEHGQLVLDHDHTSGMTRGYLCRSCNGVEPNSTALAWVAWRGGINPATRFGVSEPYLSPFGVSVLAPPTIVGAQFDTLTAAMTAISRLAGEDPTC